MQTAIKSHKEAESKPERVFHYLKGKYPGATVVFFAGIHGNEFAGVDALNKVLNKVDAANLNGEIYAVYGNIKALKENKRFLELDLNRMWTTQKLDILEGKSKFTQEEEEQIELFEFIKQLFQKSPSPLYFIDLHTTSSKSLPFITINDAIINRKFSQCFPVPIVLGIEEYLEGPLLSYLNKLGYVSLGFEAGQHVDPQSIKSCVAFVSLVLKHTGHLLNNELGDYTIHEKTLIEASKNVNSIFEVIYKHHIQPREIFVMKPGFKSFQNIEKGTFLATSNGKRLYSDFNAQLFMPLYQNSGNDGFFIIRKIPRFFLKLSTSLRDIKADVLLTILPGITWYDKKQGILKANLSVTRFLAKSIFHLFGYRNKQIDETHLLLYNRERVSKKEMYKNESWY
ncbi:succinylglutamate desuccinylase/aspartoacylase family protein [Winogradskyella alexanderae]|uniref:Succinylglutamate desuccinylase/aspartoacylase family protein n=1 Tax=Winogradskyella alexanderae TaxID=2877123 RepID=A0ABS7XMQ1_9FLAO|nr:succinylglutamate desuccinylase/aspartoacylase family protein [Winogradskyella alexanderae]MCA0131251.1 succinylglutamate desuccinylase/aspartoacylase family protein [Winogradskyella alexanderae]